jgi:hypothetical protein
MFTATLFTAAKEESFKCTSLSKRIYKMWYVHTMEYCLTLKEILTCGRTQINLLLTEISQTQKNKYNMSAPFIAVPVWWCKHSCKAP